MGNSIASAMAEKQKELQKEMVQIQLDNMIKGQERMRRMMMATQVAITQERVWWFIGFGTFATAGAAAAAYHTKSVPRLAVVPLAAFWTGTMYQWDLAYGNKANRINDMTNKILADPSYWFNPVMPDKVEVPPLNKKK